METAFAIALFVVSLIIVISGLLLGVVRAEKRFNEEFGVTHVSEIRYDYKRLHFKGGRTGTDYTFYGDCTVWTYPDGTECPTHLEVKLWEIWHKWKMDQEI